MQAEPFKGRIDIGHSEHDAQVTECIHRSVPVIGDYRRREESRELEPTVAVWSNQHGDLDALVYQSGDASGPVAFYHGATFELQADLRKKCNGGVEGLHHDAHVI